MIIRACSYVFFVFLHLIFEILFLHRDGVRCHYVTFHFLFPVQIYAVYMLFA